MPRTRKHPSEAELQYYAELGSETEKTPVHKHVEECSLCRDTVQVYRQLNSQIGKLPLLTAPDGFADRIVSAVMSKNAVAEPEQKRSFICPEIQNAFIATAATYFFIASGVLGRLVALDGLSFENNVDRTVYNLLQLMDTIRSMLT